MPSTVEQLSPTRVKITIEVPFSDLKPSMDKAYADIARTINVPGFRRGKVPPMVVDQRFGRGVVIQEAFNDSWSRFYGEAVTANQLTPLAQPDVEVTKLEDGDLIEFTAEVDVRPDFEVPDPATIEVQVDALDVPDSLVDEQLDVLRRHCDDAGRDYGQIEKTVGTGITLTDGAADGAALLSRLRELSALGFDHAMVASRGAPWTEATVAAVAAIQPVAGNHYLSDVLVGGVIGWVSEALVDALFNRVVPPSASRKEPLQG